jgi:hypothetical protein
VSKLVLLDRRILGLTGLARQCDFGLTKLPINLLRCDHGSENAPSWRIIGE